jgi:hypothetical protein
MAKMGRYSKAYPLDRLRGFSGWAQACISENSAKSRDQGGDQTDPNTAVSVYLYLHEDYTVTADIFIDEQMVFDRITEEWKAFCRDSLQFEVPTDHPASPIESAMTRQTASDQTSQIDCESANTAREEE